MTSGPKAGSRGKGKGEEVKTMRDNITLLTLCKHPSGSLGHRTSTERRAAEK